METLNEIREIKKGEVINLASCLYLYHPVIFHLIWNTHFNGLLNPDLPLKSTAPFWRQNYLSWFYFGNSSYPSISRSVFSIWIRLTFVLFKNMLDENKVIQKPYSVQTTRLVIIFMKRFDKISSQLFLGLSPKL